MGPEFSADARLKLLGVARKSLEHGLTAGVHWAVSPEDYTSILQSTRASFVTLNIEGQLRGCIGGLEPRWALVEDVSRHAFAAGFHDPRFPPISKVELANVRLHVSVLSPRTPLAFTTEAELIAALRPGIDGLVLQLGAQRATFLPAVWESLDDPVDFVAELKRKAGISAASAPDHAERYHAESFEEQR